jgi:hypothetical protein
MTPELALFTIGLLVAGLQALTLAVLADIRKSIGAAHRRLDSHIDAHAEGRY